MDWQFLIEAWLVFLAAAIGVFLFKILTDTWSGPK
jgi:hypothetical protein